MILGGAVGNLYDRLAGRVDLGNLGVIRHQVRNFINLSHISVNVGQTVLNYPYIFNVADVLLVAGVAALLIRWWRTSPNGIRKDRKAHEE